MQQPRYFSTQPSANAVPAQQLMAMMPPQQGHMVANGQQPMKPMAQQPMMQQPMMAAPNGMGYMMPPQGYMMPMMQQNGQYVMPMMPAGMQMQQPAAAKQAEQVKEQATLPNNVTPKLTHAPKQKMFTVSGVTNPHLLKVEAPSLSWQMTKEGENYNFTYDPQEMTHDVRVTYGENKDVEGSPFQLRPSSKAHKSIELNLNADEGHLTCSGVPDVDKLHFDTTMAYKLVSDPEDAQKFHLHYETDGRVHPLDVKYNGLPVTNGKFEFVPKHMKPQRELQAQAEDLKQQYEATMAKLDALQLNAPAPTKAIEAAPVKEVRSQEAEKAAADEEPAVEQAKEEAQEVVKANEPHMTETAPKANYGPMVMSSATQQHQPMVPQQAAQPMMAQQAAQPMMPMMMPMGYAGGNMMAYPMMPQMQQGQQPMYRQG